MTVSNALPIQFWLFDEQTYNENQVCGVEPRCWCAPWQCDDEIKLQINTSDEENPEDFSYAVLNSEDVFVFNEDFDSNGGASFIPEDDSICGGEYRLLIYDNTSNDVFALSEPEQWDDFGEPGSPEWTKDDGAGSLSVVIGNEQDDVGMTMQLPDGAVFTIPFHVTITGTWGGSVQVGALIVDTLDALKDDVQLVPFTSNVSLDEQSITFTVKSGGGFSTDPMAYLKFRVVGPSSGTATVTIFIDSSVVVYIGEGAIIYKSDCLDIREEQECTELIEYSNDKNFAGLVYEGISPRPSFSLRLPAVFFHESFPQEEEVHPLSTDTWIQLYSRIERKKNLDLGYMPYYMHQKIQLVLMHDNIEIRGEEWTRRDPYNIEEAHKRFPKPKANVMLTDKNFIFRNLI